MKISELPQDLRELAEKRRAEDGRVSKTNLNEAFSWMNTTEGYHMWRLIYDARFDEARKLLNQ